MDGWAVDRTTYGRRECPYSTATIVVRTRMQAILLMHFARTDSADFGHRFAIPRPTRRSTQRTRLGYNLKSPSRGSYFTDLGN